MAATLPGLTWEWVTAFSIAYEQPEPIYYIFYDPVVAGNGVLRLGL